MNYPLTELSAHFVLYLLVRIKEAKIGARIVRVAFNATELHPWTRAAMDTAADASGSDLILLRAAGWKRRLCSSIIFRSSNITWHLEHLCSACRGVHQSSLVGLGSDLNPILYNLSTIQVRFVEIGPESDFKSNKLDW